HPGFPSVTDHCPFASIDALAPLVGRSAVAPSTTVPPSIGPRGRASAAPPFGYDPQAELSRMARIGIVPTGLLTSAASQPIRRPSLRSCALSTRSHSGLSCEPRLARRPGAAAWRAYWIVVGPSTCCTDHRKLSTSAAES